MVKEKIESALKLNDVNSLVIDKDFYKSKEKNKEKKGRKKFVYELIPHDNYEKNKKNFKKDSESNLIEKYGIKDILNNNKYPLQEKVKNFDIQYEDKIFQYKEIKDENNKFNERYNKYYKEGEHVDFIPFKNQLNNDEGISVLQKEVFKDILISYEKKNMKIPDILNKNIFEYSPLLVPLEEIENFFRIEERLEDPNLIKEVRKMLKIYNFLKNNTNIGNSLYEYKENDFYLEGIKVENKENIQYLKKNKDLIKYKIKIQNFIDRQTDKLKEILDEKEMLMKFKEIRQNSK